MQNNDTIHNGDLGDSLLYIGTSWGLTFLTKIFEHMTGLVTMGNISGAFSCGVSIMIIRHYWITDKKKKNAK